MKMQLKRTINGKDVVEVFRCNDKISIYEEETDWCGYPDKEHPCIQYVVVEPTGEVLYQLKSDAAISVKAVL